MKKMLAALLLSGSAATAVAQEMPPAGRPHGPGMVSPELLATIPDLTTVQQADLRKLLLERRDAHEAVEAKSRAERDALRKKDRAEHERIDSESAERVRKMLGDDGYRRFAEWQLSHHGPPHGPGDGPMRGRPPGPGAGKKMALGPAPGEGDDD